MNRDQTIPERFGNALYPDRNITKPWDLLDLYGDGGVEGLTRIIAEWYGVALTLSPGWVTVSRSDPNDETRVATCHLNYPFLHSEFITTCRDVYKLAQKGEHDGSPDRNV